MDKSYLSIANSRVMLFLCAATVLVVLIQPVIFLLKARKRSREIGLTSENFKAIAKSSAIFSLIPSLPILIGYMLMIASLGKYFPWLRLSVLGSVSYEIMAADIAAVQMGYEGLSSANFTSSEFALMLWVVTLGIMGGHFFILFFLKGYDKNLKKVRSGGGAMVSYLTTALFLGMFSVMVIPNVTNMKNIPGIVSVFVSGITILIMNKIVEKHTKMKEFVFSISLLAGMIAASVTAQFI